MAFLKSHSTASVATPVPTNVSTELLLDTVRDHHGFASRSPFVSRVYQIETRPEVSAKFQELLIGSDKIRKSDGDQPQRDAVMDTWEVQETVPWYGRMKHICGFENVHNGVDTIVCAPLGTWLGIRLRVVESDGAWHEDSSRPPETEQGVMKTKSNGRVLVEETVIEANVLLMPYIKYNWAKAHRDIHASLLRELEEKDRNGSSH